MKMKNKENIPIIVPSALPNHKEQIKLSIDKQPLIEIEDEEDNLESARFKIKGKALNFDAVLHSDTENSPTAAEASLKMLDAVLFSHESEPLKEQKHEVLAENTKELDRNTYHNDSNSIKIAMDNYVTIIEKKNCILKKLESVKVPALLALKPNEDSTNEDNKENGMKELEDEFSNSNCDNSNDSDEKRS